MEFLNDIIEKRLEALKADIVAGAFKTEEELLVEMDRLISVMTKTAILKGIKKDVAEEHIRENFASKVVEFYDQNVISSVPTDMPENYFFASIHEEIKTLIEAGNLQEADEKIDHIFEILEDKKFVEESIRDGVFTQNDADYFREVANPYFQELKDKTIVSKPKKQGLLKRIQNGVKFIVTGKNPYDNQTVKVKRKKQSKRKISNSKIAKWAKKHKVSLTAAGLVVAACVSVGAGIFIAEKFLHNGDEQSLEDSTIEQTTEERTMATFEVDESHNFNINDQTTHTEILKLIAKAVMERGIPVVSEEECMKFETEGKLAVSPEQLNNWLISINLEDMDDLTFTKLLANSKTDKEELMNDFLNINRLFALIYTTKQDTPFIYKFISNKEYSEYIKAYEEAMIQNQKGNPEDLIALIKNRVQNSLETTSSGPLGLLTSRLIYHQENVYNAEVIGQDIMDLYNAPNDECTTANTKACFYSDNWAEYMIKLDSKLNAAIGYNNSMAYAQYLVTLTDAQNDNKVYIEDQVLPYLKENNIVLGEWNVLENILYSNREVKTSEEGKSKESGAVADSSSTKVKTVSKQPTTKEEKKVQAKVESDLEKENRQNFENTVKNYALSKNGTTTKDENGNLVIWYKDGNKTNQVVVDSATKGAYDASKDYKGTTYEEGQEGYDAYKEDRSEQAGTVENVGNVVITKEENELESNFYMDGEGNIIDKLTGNKVILGTEEELDKFLANNPECKDWLTTEDGDIYYSNVDNQPNQKPQEPNQKPSDDLEGTLTPEEQEELDQMENGTKPPEAGEILNEEYSNIVYKDYTVEQLVNNPALCKNIPEEILNQYPEILSIYQNWLEEQKQNSRIQTSSQVEESPIQNVAIDKNIAAQKAMLKEEKATLVGNPFENVPSSKVLEKTL